MPASTMVPGQAAGLLEQDRVVVGVNNDDISGTAEGGTGRQENLSLPVCCGERWREDGCVLDTGTLAHRPRSSFSHTLFFS